MISINERLKTLRDSLDYSQEEFGKILGITRSGVSNIESGLRKVNEKHIKFLVNALNVNEHWLRTGEGEMHVQTDSALLDDLAAEYNMSEKQRKIIATFAAMDEKKREVLAEAFFEFVDALVSSPEVSATIAARPAASDTKLTVEQKRQIVMAELPNEEKGQISSVSTITNGSKLA